jgi:peptidoglycan/xylan/chitin deacetylase (PgdA/CDA1 family)
MWQGARVVEVALWRFGRIVTAFLLYYSGIVPLARWWSGRPGKRLLILAYHRATEGDLRRHLLYLRRHYRILPLETALMDLYEPSDCGLRGSDHRAPLAITFDDGYVDNFTDLRVLATELQIPITVFLIAGYMNTHRPFWWLEPGRLVSHAAVQKVALSGRTYRLAQARDRQVLTTTLYGHLRHATSVAKREAFLHSLRDLLKVPPARASDDVRTRSLTWQEVHQLEATGYFSFGAHTVHHPVLAALDEMAEVQREVSQCRSITERHLGHAVLTFAYPMGQMKDIGACAPQAVKQSGYSFAVTTEPGFNTPRTCPHLLRRTVVGSLEPTEHWLVMAAEAAGVWEVVSRSGLSRAGTYLLRHLWPARPDRAIRRPMSATPLSDHLERP